MSKTISKDEVAKKNSADAGMYIIVDDSVYDVTEFVNGKESPTHGRARRFLPLEA